MNNSIYRRPFTLRCFTNNKRTSPHHRSGKTANFKVSAGKIPHTAHCRERFTCQTPKGKAVLRTREGLLLDSRHVQAAKQTVGSAFSSLEIIWMVFECLCLNVTPPLPKLKPSMFYCVSTCLQGPCDCSPLFPLQISVPLHFLHTCSCQPPLPRNQQSCNTTPVQRPKGETKKMCVCGKMTAKETLKMMIQEF